MTAVPSLAETRANATYDALLWALSRPGRVRTMPDPGAAAIVDALLDRECRVFCADPALAPVVLRSGAEITALDTADHVFLGPCETVAPLRHVRLGSDLYPGDGATVVLDANLSSGPTLRFSGPGVDGTLDISVGGLPDGFWAERARLLRYPIGFDLFLLDGAQVMGCPRSTQVEVL